MNKSLYAFVLTVLALTAAATLVALHDLSVDVLTGVIGVAIGGGGAVGVQQIGGGSPSSPAGGPSTPVNASGRQSTFPG